VAATTARFAPIHNLPIHIAAYLLSGFLQEFLGIFYFSKKA